MTTASVFLLSHNKGEYALEAIESVLRQTFADFELWVLENSTDTITRDLIELSGLLTDNRILYNKIELGNDRDKYYPAARVLNMFYPCANGEYIFYLSDDDLLEPRCLERCIQMFTGSPGLDVVYFGLKAIGVSGPRQSADFMIGYLGPGGTMVSKVLTAGADQAMDGGQIVHRKSCLEKLSWPYFDERLDCAYHADGLFMESLLEHFPFYPLNECLLVHRYTPLSKWVGYDKYSG